METVSGATLGLYNDFMCPYEREFGRVLGYFLTSEPILHGHLGIVWDRGLRDRLVHAADDPSELHHLKQTYGRAQTDEEQAREHIAFLTTMFIRLNAGAPRRARCPGGCAGSRPPAASSTSGATFLPTAVRNRCAASPSATRNAATARTPATSSCSPTASCRKSTYPP
ncbi:hypothetical protein RB201_36070 [Streptomyces sp. S1A(2023)]